MKRVLLLSVVVSATIAASLSDVMGQAQCFRVESPAITDEGTTVTVEAKAIDPKLAAKYDLPRQKFNWSVNAGKIVSGQGTSAIKVDTTNAPDRSISITANVTGLPKTCDDVAVALLGVGPQQGYHSAYTGKVRSETVGGDKGVYLEDLPASAVKAKWALVSLFAIKAAPGTPQNVLVGFRLGKDDGPLPVTQGTISIGEAVRNAPLTLDIARDRYVRETVVTARFALGLDVLQKITASGQPITVTIGDDTVTVSPETVRKFDDLAAALK